MPRDEKKLLRSPSFRSKLSSITGMEPEEKALVVRIGNLVDFLTYEQRQETNPQNRSRKKSAQVPAPTNVTATGISGGVVIEWTAVDISGLSFYEVQIDTDSVFSNPASFEVIDTRFVIKDEIDTTIFIRVRTVTKQGEVSSWSSTSSLRIQGTSVTLDFDHINPENRTTVLPKPTLSGITQEIILGDNIFVGIGGVAGNSPLTIEDRHIGFPTKSNRQNEIAYDLIEESLPFPSYQTKVMGIPDDFIEKSDFYVLEVPGTSEQRFYYKTFIYPGSFVDFFDVVELDTDPSTINVELLRYRIINSFYQPDYAQAGFIESATMSSIKL